MGIAVRFSTVIWVEAMVGLSFLGPRKIDPPYSCRHNRPVVSEKSCRPPRTTWIPTLIQRRSPRINATWRFHLVAVLRSRSAPHASDKAEEAAVERGLKRPPACSTGTPAQALGEGGLRS